MIDGIVLAGGFSSRAKTNKCLLMVDNKPLICHALDNIKGVVDYVILVTGHYDKEIREIIKDKDIEIVHNKDYEKGMFSSVKMGVSHSKGDMFIIPVDCPFVKKETFLLLKDGEGDVRVPTFLGKDGHPLFLSKNLKKPLLEEDEESNLKKFRNKYEIHRYEVNDKNILNDIDTIEDYQRLILERK